MLLTPLSTHKTILKTALHQDHVFSKCAVNGQNKGFSVSQPVDIIYFDFQKAFFIHIHRRWLRILG